MAVVPFAAVSQPSLSEIHESTQKGKRGGEGNGKGWFLKVI